jgi:hypothetical protein
MCKPYTIIHHVIHRIIKKYVCGIIISTFQHKVTSPHHYAAIDQRSEVWHGLFPFSSSYLPIMMMSPPIPSPTMVLPLNFIPHHASF